MKKACWERRTGGEGTVYSETLPGAGGGGAILALQKTLESKPRGSHTLIAFEGKCPGQQTSKL